MDIAEIRKKTRSRAKTPAVTPPVSQEQAAAAAVAGGSDDGDAGRLPAVVAVAVPGESGLDRLFAVMPAAGGAADDVYQSALVAQDDLDSTGFLQCLAFQLGAEEYALDITCISEIIKPRECTDIPRVPDFIVGLISLRGVVVPVLDLRRRFRLGDGPSGPEARIVVCRDGEVTAGLLVDSITQVLRLSAEQIEPPPAVLSGIDRQLVEGIGRCQGRMVILLNLASVLDVGVT